MTESDWESCSNPQRMLSFLRDSGEASDRELRPFPCACCRHIRGGLTDPRSRRGVEIAEQFADGQTTRALLEGGHREARAAFLAVYYRGVSGADYAPAQAVNCLTFPGSGDELFSYVSGVLHYTAGPQE